MAAYTKPGAEVFAPTDNAGNPRSVDNGDAQVWATEVERELALSGQGYSANYATRAQLYADLAHPAGSLGRVFDDSNSSLNGIYKKSGASGAGSWTRIGPLAGGGALSSKDAVGTEDIEDASVTLAKFANVGTDKLLGRDAGGSGAPTEIGVGAGLEFDGSNGIRVADGGVSNAKLANMTQGTVKMRRAGAGTGAPTNTALADLKSDLALTKSDVGLSNADNTSDVNKPISNAADAVFIPLTLGNDLIYIGTAYDLEAVTPAGEVVQGTDKATGLPLVGGSGGGGVPSDLSLVTVLRSSDLLQIHFPQAGGRYVRWNFAHLINAGQNSDVWQVYGVDDASLSGGVSTKVETICNAGQVEFAARPFGGSFTIGGNAHGRDEIIETPTLLIDGAEVDITGGNAVFTGRRVEIFQASQLLDSTDLSNFAKRYTRWVFEDGELELTNHLVIEKEIAFDTIYMSMLPILHLSGATEITHSGIRAPLFYPVEAFVGSDSSETTADEIKLWGDKYSGEVQALEGWDDAGRESWVAYSSGDKRNKIYFAPLGVGGEYTPALGSVLRMRSRLRVSIMNA
jgi:hypothetical protein